MQLPSRKTNPKFYRTAARLWPDAHRALFRSYQRAHHLVIRSVEAGGFSCQRNRAIDGIDFRHPACHMVKQHRRPCIGDFHAECTNVRDWIGKVELDAARTRHIESLGGEAGCDLTGISVVDDFNDRALRYCTSAREANVANQLFPDQLIDVIETFDAKPART